MKSVHVSLSVLLVALGQLLVAIGQRNVNAVGASVTAILLAFLPAVTSWFGPDPPPVE
jgi:hypothetical protein